MGRPAHILVAMVCVALFAACGPVVQTPRQSSESAVLAVQCEVEDAEVWLNSRYFRTAGELTRGVRLAPGAYRVEVRHSDFHSMYYDIELVAKQRRTLEVSLAQRFR